MATLTVYVVWTLEDSDNVSVYLDEALAEAEYKEYGEFGCWKEEVFQVSVDITLKSLEDENDLSTNQLG